MDSNAKAQTQSGALSGHEPVEDKQAKIEELAERYADGQIDYLDGITVAFEDWWFNVRPSNTEPYLRLVLEAGTPAELARHRGELETILGQPV